jgi:hypothetical protein
MGSGSKGVWELPGDEQCSNILHLMATPADASPNLLSFTYNHPEKSRPEPPGQPLFPILQPPHSLYYAPSDCKHEHAHIDH